jgi:hypothetical protein
MRTNSFPRRFFRRGYYEDKHRSPNAEGEFLEGPSIICEESSDTEEHVIRGTHGAHSKDGREVTEHIPHTDSTYESGQRIFLSPTEKTGEFEMQPEVSKDHTIGNAIGQQVTQDATRFADLDHETNVGLQAASTRPSRDPGNTIENENASFLDQVCAANCASAIQNIGTVGYCFAISSRGNEANAAIITRFRNIQSVPAPSQTSLKSEAGQTSVTEARRLHFQERSQESCRNGIAEIMRSKSTSKSLT